MTASPYLRGNFAPVEEEHTALDLKVTGQIPRELEGRLLRIGPNPVDPDPENYHWFLGNGMVHGVRLRDGRAEWYRNRYVRDDELSRVKGWPEVGGPKPPHQLGDGVANTNVIGHAGKTWAIVEAGNCPVELDYELETVARNDFEGTLPGGFTAHPKRDPETGELHAAVYSPFWNHIQYVVVGTDGRVRKTVDVPTPGSPMVHDCHITENYFILLDFPVIFTPEMLTQGYGLPYRWTPEYGARVGLLPREGTADDVVWNEVELCFAFHPMNAYEDQDGKVVLDIARHPKMFDRELLGPNEGPPTLDRWIVDPKGGKVKEQRLDDRPQEFPRHDERLLGKPYRYGYTATFAGDETGLAMGGLLKHDRRQEFPRHDERLLGKPYRYGYTATFAGDETGLAMGGLLKHDLRDGKTAVHDQGRTRQFMEPVFVPASADADEDEGYVLAYVHDAAENRADVVILHAQDFGGEPVATVHLPARVPFGFHGNWVPDEA